MRIYPHVAQRQYCFAMVIKNMKKLKGTSLTWVLWPQEAAFFGHNLIYSLITPMRAENRDLTCYSKHDASSVFLCCLFAHQHGRALPHLNEFLVFWSDLACWRQRFDGNWGHGNASLLLHAVDKNSVEEGMRLHTRRKVFNFFGCSPWDCNIRMT